MRPDERIGFTELSSLLYLFLLGSSLLQPMGVQAKQASWLAVLLGGLVGLVLLYVHVSLHRLTGGQSLIKYSQTLLGKWPGRLVGLLYLWFALHVGALVLRNFTDFLTSSIMSETPFAVLAVALILLCAYGAHAGIEAVSRTAPLLAAVITAQTLLVTVFVLKDVHPGNLLPVLGPGPLTLAKATWGAFNFPFGDAVIFAILLSPTSPSAKVWRSARLGMVAAVLLLALSNALSIAVIGIHGLATARYPIYTVYQTIDLADVITRIDALLVGSWVALGFAKITVCLLAVSQGLAEWSGVRQYRPLVIPLALWMVALSHLVFRIISEGVKVLVSVVPVYTAPLQILIPLVLLGLAWMRRRPTP